MIRRLYVDNFRSLVDFSWEPGSESLVLGANGSGKTSVLDALRLLQAWVGGAPLPEILAAKDRCRWMDRDTVRFSLSLSTNGRDLDYDLSLKIKDYKVSVHQEYLQLETEDDLTIVLDRDPINSVYFEKGRMVEVELPDSQSFPSFLRANRSAPLVREFIDAIDSILIVQPVAPLMKPEALRPEARPSCAFENFVAWYWEHSTNGSFQRAMLGLLDDVWPEFDHLKMDAVGREARVLAAVFKRRERASGEFVLDFDELSDGERTLVALYALIAYQKSHPGTTLIVDEPDNFVSLPELQPWLLRLLQERPDDGQVILVSHNSEIIGTMGESRVSLFEREDHLSGTTVRGLQPDDSGLSLSERMTRGWLSA